MPDFDEIQHLTITPTCCVFCGSVDGPFITMVPERWLEGYGVVAVCAGQGDHSRREAGCIEQMARHKNMVDQPIHRKVLDERDRLEGDLTVATHQLATFEAVREAVAALPAPSETAATVPE